MPPKNRHRPPPVPQLSDDDDGVPYVENFRPSSAVDAPATDTPIYRRRKPLYEKLPPSEAFKRGFYGGFGLWCSFMVLNIVVFLIGLMLLTALGVIGAGAAAVSP